MSNPPEELSIPGPDELPELARALRALDAESDAGAPAIPASLDSAIRDAARAQLAGKPSGTIRLLPWLSLTAAAAAAVVVTAGVWAGRGAPEAGGPVARESTPTPAQPAPASVVIAGDVNTDGRLDIIDAYLVARRAKQRDEHSTREQTPDPDRRWDHNGDGAVTRADADSIALAAVTLPEGKLK